MITMRCNVCGNSPCVEQQEKQFGPKKKCKAPTSWWGWSSGSGSSKKDQREEESGVPETKTSFQLSDMQGWFVRIQTNPDVPREIRQLVGNTNYLRQMVREFQEFLENQDPQFTKFEWKQQASVWFEEAEVNRGDDKFLSQRQAFKDLITIAAHICHSRRSAGKSARPDPGRKKTKHHPRLPGGHAGITKGP